VASTTEISGALFAAEAAIARLYQPGGGISRVADEFVARSGHSTLVRHSGAAAGGTRNPGGNAARFWIPGSPWRTPRNDRSVSLSPMFG
jgi:hypothetical protein